MGVVYRATDLSLERPVALKLIAPELAEDEHFRERFLKEPRLAASLDHPNVLPIYEAGERDGQLYLAMRYVEGSDLKTLLAARRQADAGARARDPRPGRRAPSTPRTGAGSSTATSSPRTCWWTRTGHAYLADFGLTKQAGGASTETGQIVGTLDYLAPEQIRGEEVDGAHGRYALACVLYECLAGRAAVPPRDRGGDVVGAHAGASRRRSRSSRARPRARARARQGARTSATPAAPS